MAIFSRNSWRDTYEEMLPRVFHYFAYRVGDTQTAEDLTSQTFVKAWKARANFKREKGRMENWLFGIARNVAIDHYRERKNLAHMDDFSNIPGEQSVEQTYEQNHKYEKLSRILNEQSERVRELISLKYGGELTNRRIAKLTGLSETNVGTILHRAVNALREQWEDHHG